MRIAQVIPYLGVANGGPPAAMAALAGRLAEIGNEVAVFSLAHPQDGEPVLLHPAVVKRIAPCRGGSLRFSPEVSQSIFDYKPELIHSHGLWTFVHYSASKVARELGVPHVIATCGMLAPAALQRSRCKKLIASILFQTSALRRASCIHAKSGLELQHIRSFGLTNPAAVIPTALMTPAVPDVDAATFRRDHGLNATARLVLFLGRIHPVKGLTRLVHAWIAVHRSHPDWTLVIAGPDEGHMQQDLQRALLAANAAESVLFIGQVAENAKWAAYKAAELFVMPSDFENFGIAIAEAMSCGRPVITTDQTPWVHLPETRAGWCVPTQELALADALTQALSMSREELSAMGECAQRLIKDMTPERTTLSMTQVYNWVSRRANRPGFVQ